MDLLNHFKAIPAHLILSRLIWQFSVDDFYAPDSYVWSNPSSCPLEYLVQPYGFDLWNILDGFGWMNIWEYFGGSKPCKSKGQVKLGPWLKTKFYEDLWPLVYLGLIELSPFSPHVHRRQVTLFWFQSHEWRPKTISVQCGSWLEPLLKLKLLMHDWKAPFFSITFRSQPLMGFSKLQWKATKTDIAELLQSKFLAVSLKKLLMILHFSY